MLITSRLRFRHFVSSDLDELYREIYHKPEVATMLSSTGTISREQTASILYRRLKHWQEHGFGAWALIDKQSQELVGHCGLHYLGNQPPEVELTYTIKPTHWGKGLATEAGSAVLQWGFTALKLSKIVAVTGLNNLASQRVLTKLGMRYEKNMQYNSTEVMYYAISRTEWQSRVGWK